MRRVTLFLLSLTTAGCTTKTTTSDELPPEVMRDVAGYAIAACLVNQPEPYLKDQGDAWASAVMQRMKGSPDILAEVAKEVASENAKGAMAVIPNETGPDKDKTLPLLYCYEIIHKPAIHVAIQKALTALKPFY